MKHKSISRSLTAATPMLIVCIVLALGASAAAQQAQSCSARAGYPKGRWAINNASAEYAQFITFTRPNGGTWLPSTGQGSFESLPSPSAGAEVVIRFHVDSGNYESTNKLVVSSDGCRMTGTYSDTEGHRGEASYSYQGVR